MSEYVSIADLPKAKSQRDEVTGQMPDGQVRFANALLRVFQTQRDAQGSKPTALGTRLRHSDTGKCSRFLGMKAAGFPVREELDEAAVWVLGLGELIHIAWQAALPMLLPDAHIEIEPKGAVVGVEASGHFDAVIIEHAYSEGEGQVHHGRRLELDGQGQLVAITDGGVEVLPAGHRVLVEYKTKNGYGFKHAVGERGDRMGPGLGYRYQAALNAAAVDADEAVISMVSLEAISEALAAKAKLPDINRIMAEWSMSREEYLALAKTESARFTRILELVDSGKLPPTQIPDDEIPRGARIVKPYQREGESGFSGKGRWELIGTVPGADGEEPIDTVLESGTAWQCDYCALRPQCAQINNAGIVDIDEARRLAYPDDERTAA